jgi:putative ABC transport system permease protein
MKTIDVLGETYAAITVNKVRTGLTILGIVIGISSVIAMVSIGAGAQGSIESSIQSIGSNLLIVMPGFQRGVGTQVSAGRGSAQTLVQADSDVLKTVAGVKAVAPETSRRYQVTARGKNTNTQIIGTVPEYPSVRNVAIAQGAFISAQAVQSASKVAVIGPTTRDDLFGEGANPIGETIRINRIDFKIVGMTQSKGGSGFTNQDDVIYIPLTTAQRFLTGNDGLTTISVQAANQQDMALVQQTITAVLLEKPI